MDTHAFVKNHGTTIAEDAGITLRDKPSPLWRLLVVSVLLSKPIAGDIAIKAASELSKAGWRTPKAMAASTWQQRVDALGRGGYRRYDESAATMLGEDAEQLIEHWSGDLRNLRAAADGDAARAQELLQEFKGLGPVGASIFLREVQGVWTELRPYVDDLAAQGAKAVGLPADTKKLYSAAPHADFHRLLAACVRAAQDESIAAAVKG